MDVRGTATALAHNTHVAEIPVEHLYVSVDDLERDELVVSWGYRADEEERGIAAVDDFGVFAESVRAQRCGTWRSRREPRSSHRPMMSNQSEEDDGREGWV